MLRLLLPALGVVSLAEQLESPELQEPCRGSSCTAGAGFVQYRRLLSQKASVRDEFCQGKTGLYAAPAGAEGNINCRGFYNCFHGNEAMQLCGSGLRFSPTTMNCDWEANVACDVVTTEGPGVTTTVTMVTTVQATTAPPVTTTGGSSIDPSDFCIGKVGLYAAPVNMAGNEDCRGYFNCFRGDEPMQLCAQGQRFSADLKNCDWRANVPCSEVTETSTTAGTTAPPGSSSSTTSSTTAAPSSTSSTSSASSTSSTSAVGSTAPATTPGPSGKIFVAYFANWFQWWPAPYKFMPSDIAAEKITHLNYAFAMIHSSTFQIRHFEDNDVSNWGTGNWQVPCSQQAAGCTKGLYEQVNDLKA